MYERHYNLTGSPFQLTPDTRFFYGSRGHSRAIAHLTFGLAQGEGFVIVTGEVGAGKTTLIERLLSQLDRDTYAVARVNTTQVSGDDLFRLALAGFGVDPAAAGKSTLLLRFEEALRDHRLAGRRCLLIVDEVQNLDLAALEELRMLSNLTERGRASLQTILMGQPQFRRMLASPDLDQLRQRVLASYHLGPLGERRDPGLHRAPAHDGRLARQPALGGCRLRRRFRAHRRHSAPDQPAVRAGAARTARWRRRRSSPRRWLPTPPTSLPRPRGRGAAGPGHRRACPPRSTCCPASSCWSGRWRSASGCSSGCSTCSAAGRGHDAGSSTR